MLNRHTDGQTITSSVWSAQKEAQKIVEWIRAQRFMGWHNGTNPMRTQLFERFRPKYTAITAVLTF